MSAAAVAPDVGQIWQCTKKGETWLIVRIVKLAKATPSTPERAHCEVLERDGAGRFYRRVDGGGCYCNTTVKASRFGRDFVKLGVNDAARATRGGAT